MYVLAQHTWHWSNNLYTRDFIASSGTYSYSHFQPDTTGQVGILPLSLELK